MRSLCLAAVVVLAPSVSRALLSPPAAQDVARARRALRAEVVQWARAQFERPSGKLPPLWTALLDRIDRETRGSGDLARRRDEFEKLKMDTRIAAISNGVRRAVDAGMTRADSLTATRLFYDGALDEALYADSPLALLAHGGPRAMVGAARWRRPGMAVPSPFAPRRPPVDWRRVIDRPLSDALVGNLRRGVNPGYDPSNPLCLHYVTQGWDRTALPNGKTLRRYLPYQWWPRNAGQASAADFHRWIKTDPRARSELHRQGFAVIDTPGALQAVLGRKGTQLVYGSGWYPGNTGGHIEVVSAYTSAGISRIPTLFDTAASRSRARLESLRRRGLVVALVRVRGADPRQIAALERREDKGSPEGNQAVAWHDDEEASPPSSYKWLSRFLSERGLAWNPGLARTRQGVKRMKTIAQAIVAKSLKAGMDPFLIAAMMIQESRLNPSAVSWAGAQGIGQLMPGTARELGVLTDKRDDRLQAQASMDGAIRYLKEQLERFAGRVDFALAAYNAGYGTVQEAGGVPNIPETRNYVREIKARRDWLKRQAARTGA